MVMMILFSAISQAENIKKDSVQTKCITKDNRVIYGHVPRGTVCKKLEPVKGLLSIVPAVSKIISLKADAHGHFTGKVLINNVVMPFLIDTGATITTIPEKLAIDAKLPIGSEVKTNTAGGKVFANKTRINSLKIDNVVLNNLDAHINKHLTVVLIGMNVLDYFKMKTLNGKDGKILTLTR